MLRVKNMTSKNTGKAVPNQFIIDNTADGTTTFQSYDSTIIEVDYIEDEFGHCKRVKVYKDWDFSKTTLKYLYQFMEYVGLYDMNNRKGFEYYMNLGCIGNTVIVKMF